MFYSKLQLNWRILVVFFSLHGRVHLRVKLSIIKLIKCTKSEAVLQHDLTLSNTEETSTF
jgi:hypothetical protein